MDNFTNESIDTRQLPKFETVAFEPLQAKYGWVVFINLVIRVLLLIMVPFVFSRIKPELFDNQLWTILAVVLPVLILFMSLISYIEFKKKGFAFRNHDVLFRNGFIATNTIVIPYNRVQHLALHEGILSRYFGLATIEIFTAGGSSSDVLIPGIAKEQAENIKQLLMGKIQKQL